MNFTLLSGAVLGFLSVLIAAYIDHAVAPHVATTTLNSLLTAIRYHQLYAVIISVMGIVLPLQTNSRIKRGLMRTANIFLVGVLLFSFSIYAVHLCHFQNAIRLTPVGGVILMLGWLGLIWMALDWKKAVSQVNCI